MRDAVPRSGRNRYASGVINSFLSAELITRYDAAQVLSTREDEPFGRTFAQISPLASLPSLMISIGRVPKATSSLLASIPSW